VSLIAVVCDFYGKLCRKTLDFFEPRKPSLTNRIDSWRSICKMTVLGLASH